LPGGDGSAFQAAGRKIKIRGRKFKAKGSEIQIFGFPQSRLLNGLNDESKEHALLSISLTIKQVIQLKIRRVSSLARGTMPVRRQQTQ